MSYCSRLFINCPFFVSVNIYDIFIFRYGEGWDFGEVAKNGRGVNASQFNLCGTGIGRYKFSPVF